jgi:hypothetical protein
MIDFLFTLPLWQLALVLNAWLMGSGLVGLWAFRRWVVPRMRLRLDTQPALFLAAAVLQSAMVLYGLVAALTAVSVWQRHSQVSDIASKEATAIAGIWRDVGGYPQKERDALRDILRGYTHQIIHEAWPAQNRGQVPTAGVIWMDRFQAQLFAYEPATDGQRILHGETLSAFNRMVDVRRLRVDSVNTGLPGVMWFVLLPGALGCVFLAFFMGVEDARVHAFLIASLAGFVAMVLFVIISLDRPYIGDMAVKPTSYELIFNQLMKRVE